jgi:hypothetical protein
MTSTLTLARAITAACAIAVATVLAGCSSSPPLKTTTCTPEQVLGSGAAFGTATTFDLGSTPPFPLNDVLKGRTDVACTATAIIHFNDGKTADRTLRVAILATPIATAREQIDKVMLAHGGSRATDSGGGALAWAVQGKSAIGATPYKTKSTLVEVLAG